MSAPRFYATTPIYYVNDRPHVGHAYTSVLTDVFARLHRLLGIDTWALTGTDEHGLKVQQAAAARGVTPQQHCDEMVVHFRTLLDDLGCAFDDFIRTTEERHTRIVARVLEKLHASGDVYLDDYEGWYCTRCERYWTEREVEERGGGRCPDFPDLHAVEWIAERNYYFRMGKYADRLRAAIEDGTFRVVPEKRANEVLGFLRQDVRDLCISRSKDKLAWGVEFPFDTDYVTYVWVDALFNYKSAIGFLHDDPARRAEHDRWWPHVLHVIGKDILTTHAVYWPTMLLALGEPLPRELLAHGWLVDDGGGKISKTKKEGAAAATGPTIESMLAVLGTDATRWFLATAMKPGDDARFDWDIVRERVNTDLANGLGNSLNRVLRMIGQSNEGRLPDLGEPTEADVAVRAAAEACVAAVQAFPATHDLNAVVQAARDANSALSGYLSDERPWKLVKDDATRPRALQVLAHAAETVRLIGLCVLPIVPEKAAVLRTCLGATGDVDFAREGRFGAVPAGTPLGDPPNLFPRVEDVTAA